MTCPEQLGVGIGFRNELIPDFQNSLYGIDFFEVIGDTGFDEHMLAIYSEWSRRIPVVCHFLNMSLGTAEPLNEDYLNAVERVLKAVKPRWFSDHLAITSVDAVSIGHLSPVFFTKETSRIIADKIDLLQQRFQLPFLIENITYPFILPGAELTEAELLTCILETAGCGILLDLSNLYINAHNLGYSAYEYLSTIPLSRVGQIHIGGSYASGPLLVDTHGHPVADTVFEYLEYIAKRVRLGGVLLERDKNFPVFSILLAEMARARNILNRS